MEIKKDGLDNSIRQINKLLSKVPVEIGDETVFLEYTMYSIIRLQEDLGIDLLSPETLASIFPNVLSKIESGASEAEVGEEIFRSLKPKLIAQLIWAGMITQNSELTFEQVAKKMSPLTPLQFLNSFSQMGKAVEVAIPSEEQLKKKPVAAGRKKAKK